MKNFTLGAIHGFENEDVIYADNNNINPEDVDIEQLSADLEAQQQIILEETSKHTSACESLEELENTVQDIKTGLESDMDLVSARLLINTLNKQSLKLYARDLQVSGLESDSPKAVLQAGLEAGEGMIDAVKQFIANVWSKIKAAFAYVWDKMKEFWAWLTGADKKIEDKKEEIVVITEAINVAKEKGSDIKNAGTNSSNTNETLYRHFKRRSKMGKGFTAKSGKFKGRDLSTLSSSEFDEYMKEDRSDNEIIDVEIEEIIIENVAKKTNIPEEKVAVLLLPRTIHRIVQLVNENNVDAILDVVNKNIEKNADDIALSLSRLLKYGVKTDITICSSKEPFPVKGAVNAWRDFMDKKYGTINYDIEKSLLDKIDGFKSIMPSVLISLDAVDARLSSGIIDYTNKIALDTYRFADMINYLSAYMEKGVMANEDKIEFGNLGEGFNIYCVNILSSVNTTASMVSPFGETQFQNLHVNILKPMKDIIRRKVSRNDLLSFKSDAGVVGDNKKLTTSFSGLETAGKRLTEELDKALKLLEKNRESDKSTEWQTQRTNLFGLIAKFSGTVQYYGPAGMIHSLMDRTKYINKILGIININESIAQAAKELK